LWASVVASYGPECWLAFAMPVWRSSLRHDPMVTWWCPWSLCAVRVRASAVRGAQRHDSACLGGFVVLSLAAGARVFDALPYRLYWRLTLGSPGFVVGTVARARGPCSHSRRSSSETKPRNQPHPKRRSPSRRERQMWERSPRTRSGAAPR